MLLESVFCPSVTAAALSAAVPRVQGRLDEEDRDETTRLAGREVASPRRTGRLRRRFGDEAIPGRSEAVEVCDGPSDARRAVLVVRACRGCTGHHPRRRGRAAVGRP